MPRSNKTTINTTVSLETKNRLDKLHRQTRLSRAEILRILINDADPKRVAALWEEVAGGDADDDKPDSTSPIAG